MQVQKIQISNFLKTANSLIIPVYQRDYAWTKINCQKLWDDIQQLVSNQRQNHFLGTIVTINDGYGKYLVIDGQQRLITITIFLLALSHYLRNKIDQNDEYIQLQKIFNGYLIDEESISQEIRIKLKPNKSDLVFFEKLFEQTKNIPENNSNIINNYLYFLSEFEKETIAPRTIFEEGVKKLSIVSIDLTRAQDDPQLIFESLNSTGVDLTAGDLIRNYILMDLEPAEQEIMYKRYWVEIEKLTGDIAEFVRNYLINKLKTWVKKDDVYSVFKIYSIDKFHKNKENTLKDLLYFANIYSWLIKIQNYPENGINKALERLNKLEFSVCHPYLFDVFNDLNSENIDIKTTKNILKTIESYAFRKILVDNTTQGLNKLFITLAKDIKKEKAWKDQYNNILNYILLEKRVSQRFPNNDEFENALINKEVYKLQSKNRNFLLESLENYNTDYKIEDFDLLTIDHFMPQTLTQQWKEKLGENWQEIYGKYLNTLGNLQYTFNNSEMSNRNTQDRQVIDRGNRLNFVIKNADIWNEKTIVDRAKYWANIAKSIWEYPKTTYSKPISEEQTFDLSSEDSFRGSKPSRLYLENDKNGVELTYWRDLLIKTCKFLYEFSPTQFNEIKHNPEFKWYFDKNKPMRNPLEFIQNEFIEGNISANGIILFLAKICERINYPAENIQFSIKNTKE